MHCGAPNGSPDALFCASCGRSLAEQPRSDGPIGSTMRAFGGVVEWRAGDVGFGILCLLGVLLVAPLPFVFGLYLFFDDDSAEFLGTITLISAAFYVAFAAIAVQFSIRKYGGGFDRLGFRTPRWSTLGWGVLAAIGAYAVSAGWVGIVYGLDLDSLKQSCDDQISNDVRDSTWVLAITAFVAVMFAPICEEIFFRGFALPGIARSWGVPAGIIGSGLLFGVAHLGEPKLIKSLPIFVGIGIVFALAYWRSNNLWSTIGAHFAFNVIGVVTTASTTCND